MLSWDPTKYDGIKNIVLLADSIWKPVCLSFIMATNYQAI